MTQRTTFIAILACLLLGACQRSDAIPGDILLFPLEHEPPTETDDTDGIDGHSDTDTDSDSDADDEVDTEPNTDWDSEPDTGDDTGDEPDEDTGTGPAVSCDEPCVRYVDLNVETPGDGFDWATAFDTVQEGIDSAWWAEDLCDIECQVWVAEGVYRIYQDSSEDTVRLREGIELYGGFAGEETALEERDWVEHPTVLTGKPDDTYYYGMVLHVVTSADDTVLDGFTITGGNAHLGSPWYTEAENRGGGIYKLEGAMTVANCNFTSNRAFHTRVYYHEYYDEVCGSDDYGDGGAIYDEGGDLVVTDSVFESNSAVHGGAIFSVGTLTVQRTSFVGNRAMGTDKGGDCGWKGFDTFLDVGSGGAIRAGGPLAIEACTFESNLTHNSGGAIFVLFQPASIESSLFLDNSAYGGITGDGSLDPSPMGSGGAISARTIEISIENCVVANNSALLGGGLSINDSCWYDEFATVNNSTVVGNSAVFDDSYWDSWTTLTGSGGAFHFWTESCSLAATNTIFQDNVADDDLIVDEMVELTYSNIEGGYEGIGNIEADPLFVDADAGDFRLQAGSPCIDAADGETAPETDIEDNPRVDDPETDNTGIGPPWADMGAYEFQP